VTEPDDRPTGARIHLPGGVELPCALVFDGTDNEGIRHWTVLTPIPLAPGASLRLHTLPARSAVAVAYDPTGVPQ
jgi:hypothetical protein